jgi:hypothetical protein
MFSYRHVLTVLLVKLFYSVTQPEAGVLKKFNLAGIANLTRLRYS